MIEPKSDELGLASLEVERAGIEPQVTSTTGQINDTISQMMPLKARKLT